MGGVGGSNPTGAANNKAAHHQNKRERPNTKKLFFTKTHTEEHFILSSKQRVRERVRER